MTNTLDIDYAFRSEAGVKESNEDCCNVCMPEESLLRTKGIAAAIADGVSSSEAGGLASQICVSGFLSDYFSTPESWTVKTAAGKVLGALNRWLCGQGQSQYDSARGMLTTFSGLILKSTTAHIVHIGDSRIYRYRDDELEQITRDHRAWVSKDKEFLSRAMGADPHVDIDYHAVAIETDDSFIFTTDGVHDFLTHRELVTILERNKRNLQACANALVETALENGSNDNASCQIIRIMSLPQETEADIFQRVSDLPFPPDLRSGMKIDGYEILREMHASKRSEVFLALDTASGEKVVLKTPSINFREDADYLDHFLHEEWVGRRIQNDHILSVLEPRNRHFLYNVTEYVEGRSLGQWIQDNGPADLHQTRLLAEQIIDGLRALHRLEMIHQDLKPDNILIDSHGTVKLIDFGSTRVAGMEEISREVDHPSPEGTLDYAAPECLRGERCSESSDLYSLGVILYEMLTKKLPYGESDIPKLKRHQIYRSVRRYNPEIPMWVDAALERAVHPVAAQRYTSLSELLHDLSHPNSAYRDPAEFPLLERDPLLFWKMLAGGLLAINFLLLYLLNRY
ncbi:MAG: bifunctional protein-serine/threonine kinase/phosphatase [Candidatus Thiodiazotropha sp. (ex Troendleina suluensis)]|nr:bifunctional protein-serine/threonine kinase/phosphatase [Candidatus Thiodiazotropha sp. (ex Troendleina suluensis)]